MIVASLIATIAKGHIEHDDEGYETESEADAHEATQYLNGGLLSGGGCERLIW